MKKNEEVISPRLGDWIVTNEEFKVKNDKGSLIVKENFYGIIIQKIRVGGKVSYGIRFGDGLEWTDNLNGAMSIPSGKYLLINEFNLDN